MGGTQHWPLDFGPYLDYLFSLVLFRKIWHHIYFLINGNSVLAAGFLHIIGGLHIVTLPSPHHINCLKSPTSNNLEMYR